ncbi:DUF3667 domain-containing protein [Rurimicrobium arvi]|uniref:DUF3667 domain-containing protein n=1 Tax=Rurimicrobium arvi TaxID=2049916 RepID=A0ABP8MTK1_9BACT
MSSSHCLNCENELKGNFCENCGQRANTHRLSIVHFIAHDFLHGILHVDKGILFTLRGMLLRPGFTAREYIEGKRIRHFNFLTLLVLLIGLDIGLGHLLDPHAEERAGMRNSRKLVKVIMDHPQQFILLLAPLFALATLLFFRRMKLNYTEHIIPALCLLISFTIADIFCTICDGLFHTDVFGLYVCFLMMMGYIFLVYYQFTKDTYTPGGFLWRIISALLSFWLIVGIGGFALVEVAELL